MIDAAQFAKATGREPEDDDLERSNCRLAGNIGHSYCGWCSEHDKPRFICGGFVECRHLTQSLADYGRPMREWPARGRGNDAGPIADHEVLPY